VERLKTSKEKIRFNIIISTTMALILFFIYWLLFYLTNNTLRTVLLLIHGIVVAVYLGHLWTDMFLSLIRNHIYSQTKMKKQDIDDVFIVPLAVPGWLTGLIERIFFGVLVAFNIPATAAGMLTWILIKMATDWHRILPTTHETQNNQNLSYGPRSLAYSSLLAGIVSLFFALIGGLICREALPSASHICQ